MGALADALTFKYLSKAELGNFTSMIRGLVDVRSGYFLLYSISTKLIIQLGLTIDFLYSSVALCS